MWDEHPVLRFAFGGLALLVAVALAGLVAWQLAQDLSLWFFGREVKAEVVDRWVEQLGGQDEGELQFEYYLQYRFTAGSGEQITHTTTVSMNEWASGGGEGDRVDVVYFPLYPQHNRLDESRYVPLLACAYVPAILIVGALVAGAWHLVRPAFLARVGEGEKQEGKKV